MLYPYKYLPHKIEKLHELVEHFFASLFAEKITAFDEAVLIPAQFLPAFKACRKTLKKPLHDIFVEYQKLKSEEKKRLQEGFESNNTIQELCAGKHTPLTYDEIPAKMQGLLKGFFNGMWENVLETKSIQAVCGTKMEHFKTFVDRGFQKAIICPFCGLEGLKSQDDEVRDPYDHYLPKAIYPFIGVSFKNLVPACKSCNSDYKKECDTFDLAVKRKKAFYPFDASLESNAVFVKIVSKEPYDKNSFTFLSSSLSWDIEFHDTGNNAEELATWNRVYRLKIRYKARIQQREHEWWSQLKRCYKRWKFDSFEEFKDDIMDDFDDIRSRENDIVQKAYYEYLFTNPELEKLLKDTVLISKD